MVYKFCTSGCLQLEYVIGDLFIDLNVGIVGKAVVTTGLPQLLPEGKAGMDVDP